MLLGPGTTRLLSVWPLSSSSPVSSLLLRRERRGDVEDGDEGDREEEDASERDKVVRRHLFRVVQVRASLEVIANPGGFGKPGLFSQEEHNLRSVRSAARSDPRRSGRRRESDAGRRAARTAGENASARYASRAGQLMVPSSCGSGDESPLRVASSTSTRKKAPGLGGGGHAGSSGRRRRFDVRGRVGMRAQPEAPRPLATEPGAQRVPPRRRRTAALAPD